MKIAFDAKRALNNATGLGNHARILLNALMRDFPEHDYLLFSPKARDELFHQLQGNFRMVFPETKIQKSFHAFWRSYGVWKQLEKERVKIYHGLSNEIPIRNRKSEIRNVVTIHDLIFLKHTEQYPFFDRQIYKLKTKYAAKHADKIVAVSQETKNDLIDFYKVPQEKIEVIYPSVDVAFQAASVTGSAAVIEQYHLPSKFILNVGSFFPRKNQRTLIEAFDNVKNQIEENLVLVGKSSTTRPEIEELIQKKNLQSRVHIVSNISNEDLPALYRAARLFIFPSLYEGFGAPVLEALFSKVPVITTQGGAMEEAGGKTSVYVNPKSAEEIAGAILSVLNNPSRQQQMIEQGFIHAQTMSDKVFAEKTMKVYRSL